MDVALLVPHGYATSFFLFLWNVYRNFSERYQILFIKFSLEMHGTYCWILGIYIYIATYTMMSYWSTAYIVLCTGERKPACLRDITELDSGSFGILGYWIYMRMYILIVDQLVTHFTYGGDQMSLTQPNLV